MKLKTTIISVILLCALFCSCGSSVESDAKRAADLKCKALKLMRKALAGDGSVAEESKKLEQEATELFNDLQKKYSSKEENEKFMKAYINASSACEQ